jgi:hypothetical protein
MWLGYLECMHAWGQIFKWWVANGYDFKIDDWYSLPSNMNLTWEFLKLWWCINSPAINTSMMISISESVLSVAALVYGHWPNGQVNSNELLWMRDNHSYSDITTRTQINLRGRLTSVLCSNLVLAVSCMSLADSAEYGKVTNRIKVFCRAQ